MKQLTKVEREFLIEVEEAIDYILKEIRASYFAGSCSTKKDSPKPIYEVYLGYVKQRDYIIGVISRSDLSKVMDMSALEHSEELCLQTKEVFEGLIPTVKDLVKRNERGMAIFNDILNKIKKSDCEVG